LVANFHGLATKKRLANPTKGIFKKLKKQNHHILRKKVKSHQI
jgi:hypothetical protein